MMKRFQTIVVNFNGGIISPGYLLSVLEVAAQYNIEGVSFGLRQQLLIEVPVGSVKAFLQACKASKIEAALKKQLPPNTVSSYLSYGIFSEDSWVTEGVYKDVFALLEASRRLLKVNVCDAQQTFVPLYTGHINWVAGSQKHYWRLYLRFPGTNNLYTWPQEVYTNDIATVTVALEQFITAPANAGTVARSEGKAVYEAIQNTLEYIARPAESALAIASFHLPYYEGFNRYSAGYWLGIYRRDELFPLRFLKEVAQLCLDSRIGELHATPWKSIIIKNIAPTQRGPWDRILGHYRINVRHAANELNWWVEDGNDDALVVKRHVIRYFDKEDVRTYGLCFGVLLKTSTPAFGSILISQKEGQRVSLKSQLRYDIYYSEDFNPNAGNYVLYREGVAKDHLGPYLVSISKLFYERASTETEQPETAGEPAQGMTQQASRKVYQCGCCGTIYDPEAGDIQQGIAPHTAFEQLPAGYTCYTCMATAAELKEVVWQDYK